MWLNCYEEKVEAGSHFGSYDYFQAFTVFARLVLHQLKSLLEQMRVSIKLTERLKAA